MLTPDAQRSRGPAADAAILDRQLPGWALSLIFWVVLIATNIITVRAYGELEYWLSLLKVITIIIFIILGIAVNAGNTAHHYIGGENWRLPGAPFVGGIGGFASVFVTAAFAYGGTESIAITAGETQNPTKNIPKVVKNVFWRILLFYVISILLIGLNVPYNLPNLNSRSTRTSPFTIVFEMVGSQVAGSFINAVILTSVLSAGNHALFAGTRLLYTLAEEGHAPRVRSPEQAPGLRGWPCSRPAWWAASASDRASSGPGISWNWLQK